MGKRKEAPKGLKQAPPPPVRKASGKKLRPAEKKAKRRSMREQSGLMISPNRCRRILGNTWQGGKISKDSEVIMAAMLQYFAQVAIERAALFSRQGPVTCAELQRAIKEMGWPEQSGLLKVHIVGAAMDVEQEHEPEPEPE